MMNTLSQRATSTNVAQSACQTITLTTNTCNQNTNDSKLIIGKIMIFKFS